MNPRAWLCVLLLALPACGSDADDEEAPLGAVGGATSVEVTGPGVGPMETGSHGGTVVHAGPHLVEVVANPEGGVEAYLVDDDPPEPGAVSLVVHAPTPEGPHPTMMIWDPEQARYRGIVRGTTVADGPVEVRVAVGGQSYRGRAPIVVMVAGGDPVVDEPQIVVVDDGEPPPPPTTVVVEHPSRPTVVVEHPPPPRAQVRVVHPGPPPGPHVVVRPGRPHHPRPAKVRHGRRGRRVSVRGQRGRARGRRGRRGRVRIRR